VDGSGRIVSSISCVALLDSVTALFIFVDFHGICHCTDIYFKQFIEMFS
jgi:hypothetical protein